MDKFTLNQKIYLVIFAIFAVGVAVILGSHRASTPSNQSATRSIPSERSNVAKSDNEVPFKVAFPETHKKTLHVSFKEVMFVLDNLFPSMEYSRLSDGRDKYLGMSAGGAAVLEVIGDIENLQQVYLMITMPEDSPETIFVNGQAMNRFIQNVAPDWGDGAIEWWTDSLEKLRSTDQVKTTRGNKVFILKNLLDTPLKGISLLITPKEEVKPKLQSRINTQAKIQTKPKTKECQIRGKWYWKPNTDKYKLSINGGYNPLKFPSPPVRGGIWYWPDDLQENGGFSRAYYGFLPNSSIRKNNPII